MNTDSPEYLPRECIEEARRFFKSVNDDIDIYTKLKTCNLTAGNEKADRFIAFWNLGLYENKPHALILLYETFDDVIKTSKPDAQNAIDILIYRFCCMYETLNENGYLDE